MDDKTRRRIDHLAAICVLLILISGYFAFPTIARVSCDFIVWAIDTDAECQDKLYSRDLSVDDKRRIMAGE